MTPPKQISFCQSKVVLKRVIGFHGASYIKIQKRKKYHMNSTKTSYGFTLIEILITLAVIAILSAIALYSYSTQIEKTRLADARSALAQNAQFMERWYADNGSYKKTSSSWPTLPITETDYYTISFTSLASGTDGSAYKLQASPKPQTGSISSGAKYLKLDQDGNMLTCYQNGNEYCNL